MIFKKFLYIFPALLFILVPKVVFADSVMLNEIMVEPSEGSDWIELYNPTSNSINLSNWVLDDANTTSVMKTLSGIIETGSFITFDVSERLNKTGDTISLIDSNGTIIDVYNYSNSPGLDKSYGRSPDGGNWSTLATSSKGSNNGSPLSTPTPTENPSPTSTPNSSSSTSSSSFTISNIPSQINSDEILNVSITLSEPDHPNSKFYLKGAFKKSDSSNYFGYTKVSNNWIKNSSSYSDQYPITTNSSGNWSGNLDVTVDSNDSGYSGSGDYIFKVGKYDSSDSNPSVSWSNEVTITIINVSTATETEPQGETGVLGTSTSSTSSPKSTKARSTSNSSIISSNNNYQTATMAAATASATPSAEIKVQGQQKTNPLIWIGFILIVAGFGSLLYIYLRNKGHGTNPHSF
ncbi:lamin tail domain-containing protein [Candidatus Daviesbacteria bacterium]|nr:lamin tail domain-containing protein [Candidatus Daviesbacteria bacterium]